MSVSPKVAGRGIAVGLGAGVCDGVAVGDDVAATVGEFATRVASGVCSVGVDVAVLVGAMGVETFGSLSPGRSNTDCATARSFDLWVAARLASAA